MFSLPGCDDSDASNISITVNNDLSGTIRSTRLAIPETPSAVQPTSGGVSWDAAAQITTARGEFKALSALTFEDITFSCETTSRGLNVLRVTLPRGPDAKWVRALTQPSADKRKATTAAIYPDQKESRLGSVIAISISLPTAPISHGAAPLIAGISEAVDKNIATLSIRADVATKPGNEIVWDLTWGEPKR